MSPLNALFVAADGGPRETLSPIATHCGSPLVEVQNKQVERDEFWSGLFTAAHPELLVVGTSDTGRGRRTESAARRTAAQMAIPIAAIEDFPGNFYDVPDGRAGLVVVESEFSRALNARKFSALCPQVIIVPPARYDPYRARLVELRRATAARWAAAENELVLWAGQPETEDALRTLDIVLPLLRDRNVALLFKAHPRDPGYRAGIYPKLFASAGLRYRDVTGYTVAQALDLAPRLVITQFSSVAIESGFFGIPSLHVLLANAGQARLFAKKGYPVPPVCLAGAAAVVSEEALIAITLDRALRDDACRATIIDYFDEYFKSSEPATPQLVQVLASFASSSG